MASLKEILSLLERVMALEQKIEKAIENEKDKNRREKIVKACRDRNPAALRKLLFEL